MRTLLRTGKDNKPIGGVPGGTFAIYDSGPDGTDHRPAVNPKGFMSRIGLHSALDYIGVVQQLDTVVTFPAVSYIAPIFSTVKLYDHASGAKPMAITLISFDGVNYGALNGDVYPLLGNIFLGRRLTVQADASSFYVRLTELGGLGAQTIWFRTYVLDRTFTGARVKTNEVFFTDGRQVRAAGGLFDTSRRYLQAPAPGQAGAFPHRSGQTLFAMDGNESAEIDFEIHNAWQFNGVVNAIDSGGAPLFSLPGASFGPAVLSNNLVVSGPSSIASGLRRSPAGLRIGAADGTDVFDTSRPIATFVDEFNRSITTATHASTAYTSEVPHEVIHAQIPLQSPVDMLLGWVEITGAPAGVELLTDMPFDISGSVVPYATIKGDTGGNRWNRTWTALSARVVAGNLEIVEQWFNCTINGDSTPTPSIDFNVRVFALAMAGGF